MYIVYNYLEMDITTQETTSITSESYLAQIKTLELELKKYKEIIEKKSVVSIETKQYADFTYDIFDKDDESLKKIHLENVKKEYSCEYITKIYNIILKHVKPCYTSRLLEDLYKYNIVSYQFNIINNLLCIIYVNVYGDCFGYLGYIEDDTKMLFKYYPFPEIKTDDVMIIRDIMPKTYLTKIIQNKSLYLLATNYYTNSYDSDYKTLHIKPTFFGCKSVNFFGPIELLNIWIIEKRKIFIKNEKDKIIKNKTTNDFSEDELNIIQENILFDVKEYNAILNIHITNINVKINYVKLAKKLKEFKIIGFYYKEIKKIIGKYNKDNLNKSTCNKKCTVADMESYYFDKIIVNYIDIYGNNYNSVFNTLLEPFWDNISGIYDFSKYLYLAPFIDSHYDNNIKCNYKLLFELIESKKYMNKKNIYQEYVFDKTIAENKIKIKEPFIDYIKSKLESNDEFNAFYEYVAEQIITDITFTSTNKMLEQVIEFFEKLFLDYKLKLFKYAKVKALGITDPSYVNIYE